MLDKLDVCLFLKSKETQLILFYKIINERFAQVPFEGLFIDGISGYEKKTQNEIQTDWSYNQPLTDYGQSFYTKPL